MGDIPFCREAGVLGIERRLTMRPAGSNMPLWFPILATRVACFRSGQVNRLVLFRLGSSDHWRRIGFLAAFSTKQLLHILPRYRWGYHVPLCPNMQPPLAGLHDG